MDSDRDILRGFTCWQCKNMGFTEGKKQNSPEKCQCLKTKRWGKLERGYYCKNFVYKQWHNTTAPDGALIKNRQNEDYRTERQWELAGRKLKNNAVGVEMYASRHNMTTKYKYYLVDETEEIEKCQNQDGFQ